MSEIDDLKRKFEQLYGEEDLKTRRAEEERVATEMLKNKKMMEERLAIDALRRNEEKFVRLKKPLLSELSLANQEILNGRGEIFDWTLGRGGYFHDLGYHTDDGGHQEIDSEYIGDEGVIAGIRVVGRKAIALVKKQEIRILPQSRQKQKSFFGKPHSTREEYTYSQAIDERYYMLFLKTGYLSKTRWYDGTEILDLNIEGSRYISKFSMSEFEERILTEVAKAIPEALASIIK